MPRKKNPSNIAVQTELEPYLHEVLVTYKGKYGVPVYKLVALCVWLAILSGELRDHFTGESDKEDIAKRYAREVV